MPTQAANDNALLYKRDFAAWADRTAELIRAGRFDGIGGEALAEEVQGLAGSDRSELYSRLRVLVVHLLKWRYRPERRGASWESTIGTQRSDLRQLFRKSPSLRPLSREWFGEVYTDARRLALIETELSKGAMPANPPFTIDQVLDDDFLP
jgi:hypothetical protein